MPIILKDGRTVKNIVSRRSGEPKKVKKITSFDVEHITVDAIDWNDKVTEPSAVEEDKWYVFLLTENGTKYAIGHDGTQLWHKIISGTETTLPDDVVWELATVGSKSVLRSRDGKYITTNARNMNTNIKVTSDPNAANLADIRLSTDFSAVHKAGYLEIVDVATDAAGNTINDAFNYHKQLIWWHESYGYETYEVVHGEDIPVLREKVWFKDYLSVEGTVTSAAYTPQIYVGSNNVSSTSPTGGQWVDCGLKGQEWEADIDGINPMTGVAYMFFRSPSNNNRYIDTITIPDGIDTSNCKSFNRMFASSRTTDTLTRIDGIGNLDTSNATTLTSMFRYCTALTSLSDISGWDVSSVTNMLSMLYGCKTLASLPDISGWVNTNVTNMNSMFYDCTSLTTIEGLLPIGDGTKSVDTASMFYNCPKLTTINKAGAIHNTVSFSYSPLTLDSAKVILRALSTPYSGAQTLTFKQTTLELCTADAEATSLIYDAISMGWTIAGFTIPADVFRIGTGDIQDGLAVENFITKETATSYEPDKYYRITANEATSVDFSGRNVDGGIDLVNLYPMSYIDISNNPKLTDFAFNREEADLTFKPYGTAWWDGLDIGSYIRDFDKDRIYGRAPSFGYKVRFHTGRTFRMGIGGVTHEYVLNGTQADSYVECEYVSGALEGVTALNGYTETTYHPEIMATVDDERTQDQWIASDKAPDTTEEGATYMSDSNWHVQNSQSRLYLKTKASDEPYGLTLYINSYAQGNYDYAIAFNLDTDFNAGSIPSYTSAGVIAHTRGFQKDPAGTLTDSWKKVDYDVPGDGQEHFILIAYRKDSSTNSSDDRGRVFVPLVWMPD